MSDPRVLPYLLIAPSLAFLGVFFVYPFVLVAIEAFQVNGAWTFDNFETMVGDWKFSTAFKNTLLLAAIVVPVQVVLALAMSVLVLKLSRGRDLILYIFTIPLGISDLAAGLIWLAIFEQTGFLNSMLAGLGIVDRPGIWLGYQDKTTLLIAVALAEIWRATAIVLVILVAGMSMIPKEYYEAGEVFGAGPWQRFTKITLPMLRPSLQTALILRTILAFEVFAVVAALAGTNLPNLMGETYNWQFALQDRGVAAALALVILGISIAATLVFLKALAVPKGAQQ